MLSDLIGKGLLQPTPDPASCRRFHSIIQMWSFIIKSDDGGLIWPLFKTLAVLHMWVRGYMREQTVNWTVWIFSHLLTYFIESESVQHRRIMIPASRRFACFRLNQSPPVKQRPCMWFYAAFPCSVIRGVTCNQRHTPWKLCPFFWPVLSPLFRVRLNFSFSRFCLLCSDLTNEHKD